MSHQAILEGGGLRLELRREGDRFHHRVWAVHADGEALLLESVESAADEVWPTSPPLQELHLESRPGGQELALLVGMAGRSHWSLSVALDAAAGRLSFDVACRVRGAAGHLGSAYRSPLAWQRRPATGELEALAGLHTARFEPDRAVVPASRVDYLAPDRVVVLPQAPADNGEPAGPRTVRWGYVVSVFPAG